MARNRQVPEDSLHQADRHLLHAKAPGECEGGAVGGESEETGGGRGMNKHEIPFTQYLLPHGNKVEVSIARPKEIYDKAMDIIKAGYRLEVERLSTGNISMTISDNDGDYDIEVIENCPEVPIAADRMITRFHEGIECSKAGGWPRRAGLTLRGGGRKGVN